MRKKTIFFYAASFFFNTPLFPISLYISSLSIAYIESNMAEGVGQEGFFWNSYPWVMPGNSSGGGGEERFSSDKNSLENHNQMKQHKMGGTLDGSSGRDQEVAATIVGGASKKNDDTLEIKKEIITEDTEVSLHNLKGKRELAPSDHDLHIWTERERRKKMRNMFHQLHALMPQLHQKVDKAAIVDEAVDYIKTLQQTLQWLETKKVERLDGPSTKTTTGSTRESFLADQGSSIGKVSSSSSNSLISFPLSSTKIFQTWVSSKVTLNVCDLDAHISICAPRKPGLLTAICYVLEKHKLEIVSADISTDELKSLFMIHVRVSNASLLSFSFFCLFPFLHHILCYNLVFVFFLLLQSFVFFLFCIIFCVTT
ncbi:putative transcription factor bHLH family [Helianthus debilis subsp. tardiflorus]